MSAGMIAATVALAAVVAAWAFNRYAPGPIRQRARYQMACYAQQHDDAVLTISDGGFQGGIGVITYDRGSVQASYDKGLFRIEWFGRQNHPVRHEALETRSFNDFTTLLAMWTTQRYVGWQTGGHSNLMMI